MVTFQIHRSAAELAGLRNNVRLLPDLTDLDHSVTDDVVLIVSELASNAIAAARPASAITVGVDRVGDEIRISVENDGPPLDAVAATLPDVDAVRGRGLAIVSLLAVRVCTHHHAGRTTVSAVRGIDARRS